MIVAICLKLESAQPSSRPRFKTLQLDSKYFKMTIFQAGDRARTGDVQLGKLTFYH